MGATSIAYLAFISAVVIAYYLAGARYRWAVLLLSSYVFYASWHPPYLLLLATTTAVNFLAAGAMGRRGRKAERRKYLWLALGLDLGLLFVFKYLDFSLNIIQGLAGSWAGGLSAGHILNLVMPIGISFYTLQTVGYMLDVYHGRAAPERHAGVFAVYVSFFPIVLSGPIERANHLLPQLRCEAPVTFSCENVSRGAKLIIMGLFYKLVLADRAAIYVDAVFGNADKHSGLTFLAATILFSFQLYGDFAGYSAVAIGSARLLGIDILANFRRPYLASSIKEFWRRWHISLSTWLRDYVFLPSAYAVSRALKRERYFGVRADRMIYFGAIFLTFLLCGLWHGARWTFVAWGAIHGLYLAVENLLRVKSRPGLLKIGTTYVLVLFSWVFFRAASVGDALTVIVKILTKPGALFLPQGPDVVAPIYAGLGIFLVGIMEIKQEFLPGRFSLFNSRFGAVRVVSYVGLIVLVLALGVFDGGQFIYAQF